MARPSSVHVEVVRDSSPARPPEPHDVRAVSLLRILRHDNVAFLLVSFGTVLFAFALFVWVTGANPGGRGRPTRPVSPAEARGFAAFTGALMMSGCALALVRAARVRRLFRVGELVHATVAAVHHMKGYSRLRLDYRHRGEPCAVQRTIRRSARARALQPGDALAILVDPQHSRRLVLAELYQP